jgi:hypothetical protein
VGYQPKNVHLNNGAMNMRKLKKIRTIFIVLLLAGISLGPNTATPANKDFGSPEIDARTYGPEGLQDTIIAAIIAIGSENRVLYLSPVTWNITKNLTIPANITLKPEKGAVIAIADTMTLTINGGIEAGADEIFFYSGTGKVVLGSGR